MMLRLFCLLIIINLNQEIYSQVSFKNSTEKYLGDKVIRSTLPVGVFDLDGDYHDDIVVLNNGNVLSAFRNQGKEAQMDFMQLSQPVAPRPEWSFAAGDLDNDGLPEIIITGVYNDVKVYKFDPIMGEFSLFKSFDSDAYGQGSNIVDVNLDGFNDYFLCHDEGESRLFYNDGSGNFTLVEGILNFNTIPVSDMSGNYGSEWVDIDDDGILELYMAKCSVRANEATDPRRINQLLKREDLGFYADIAGDIGLAHGDQSWASTFADLDNDGDLDLFIANHHTPHMMLENRDGIFEQKDPGVGELISFAFQTMAADFDNNGYIDILVTGAKDFILYNNGNLSFQLSEEVFSYFDVHSAAIGDIDHDGALDAHVSYGVPILEPGNRKDALWINEGNDNNFLKFSIKGVTSNRSGIGAKIRVFSGLGNQQRNVKGGQSYGIVNSFNCHFGMGTEDIADSVIVTWPGGEVDRFYDIEIGFHYLIQQGGCISKVLTPLGPSKACLKDPLTLEVTETWTDVTWSNGSAGSSIMIHSPGGYSASGVDVLGCPVITGIINIEEAGMDSFALPYPDTVTICEGEMINAPDPEMVEYLWSTGDMTNFIIPMSQGQYSISVTDFCGSSFMDSVFVEFVNYDIAGYADTIKRGEMDTLTFNNSNTAWYETATSSDAIFVGDSFTTPQLEESTAYYVEFFSHPDALITNVGIDSSREDTPFASDNLNAVMRFDVFENLTLNSVTCYTDVAGEREIVITDVDENEVYRNMHFIEVGENVVELGTSLEGGTSYRITTDTEVNKSVLGFNAPRLHRSAEGVFYPYTVDGLISIVGSENGPNYYYFYNWEIESKGDRCSSERVEVNVVVDFNESTIDHRNIGFDIFPNPASDVVRIENHLLKGNAEMRVYSMNGLLVMKDVMLSTTIILDVSELQPGVYFIQLSDGQNTFTEKVIKVNK